MLQKNLEMMLQRCGAPQWKDLFNALSSETTVKHNFVRDVVEIRKSVACLLLAAAAAGDELLLCWQQQPSGCWCLLCCCLLSAALWSSSSLQLLLLCCRKLSTATGCELDTRSCSCLLLPSALLLLLLSEPYWEHGRRNPGPVSVYRR